MTTWRRWACVLLVLLARPTFLAAQTVNPNRAIAPLPTTLQNAATANGNGTALNVAGYATVLLDVTCAGCSGVATINFEASADGSVYAAMQATNVTTGAIATSTTQTGLWTLRVSGGIVMVRTPITNRTAGTITVKAYPSILSAAPLATLALPSVPDGSVFLTNTSPLMPIGGVYLSSITPIISDTAQAAVALTSSRAFHVALFDAGTAIIGAKPTAGSLPVNIASDQVVPVSGTFFQTTQPVSGTVTAIQPTAGNFNATVVGTGTFPTQSAITAAAGSIAAGALVDGADVTQGLKTDARNAATDATSVSLMQVMKQISFMAQNPASRAVTNAGAFPVQPAGSVAHDGAAAAVNPILAGCYASAAAPTDVSADADATRLWCLRNGATVAQLSYAGVLAATGLGAAGTSTPRVVDVASGTTGSAVPTQAGYQAGIGSGNLTPVIACDKYKALDMTTATTTEIIPVASTGQNNYICSYSVLAAGTTVATFKYGTGANCVTTPTALGPAWDLTAQAGLTRGSGLGMVITDKTAGVTAKAICVTSSAAVNLHIEVTYTQF